MNLRTIWRPDLYHGEGKRPPFFEGWYFKLVDAAGRKPFAVIPGIFIGHDPESSHCFVQTLDGVTGRTAYYRYPAEAFVADRRRLDIRVGPSRFQAGHINLNLESPEATAKGDLSLEGLTPWPVKFGSPGIMGPYTFAPFMECYHGVVSLDHVIEGRLAIDGDDIDFSGGRGYTEKDWGQAFPAAWVWMQSNHFEGAPGTCLTASVATIPWMGNSFQGFIAGLWHGGRLYRFATYTGASSESLSVSDDRVTWRIAGRAARSGPGSDYRLEIAALRAQAGILRSPERVAMMQRVPESLTARIEVRLLSCGQVREREIFAGIGMHAGLEIVGQLAGATGP